MQISFNKRIIPDYEPLKPVNNKPVNIHTGLNRASVLSFGNAYPVLPKTRNEYQNIIWSQMFDTAFNTGNLAPFLAYINAQSRLRPLIPPVSQQSMPMQNYVNDPANPYFPVSSAGLKMDSNHNLTVTADKSGHIQISNDLFGDLFIKRADLDTYMDEINKDIIADGVRGFDPFDQDDWPRVLGTNWPTAEDTRSKTGVCNPLFDKSGTGIFLNTPEYVGKSYQTRPKALTVVDSANNSVIIAFQQENLNPSIDFAAWSILPFRVREGKKTMTLFPVEKRTVDYYNQGGYTPLNEVQSNSRWRLNNDRFFVIEASKESPKSEYLDPDVDWALFGTEGDDSVCLLRSCYKDDTDSKQFKAYSGSAESGGTKYVELEFIAPKVKAGNKSTLVYRLDFIPLAALGLSKPDKDNLEDVLKQAGVILDERIKTLRQQTVF